MLEHLEIRHFHLFCGMGGGTAGFNRSHARVGAMEARFRCIGGIGGIGGICGIDSNPEAIADFGRPRLDRIVAMFEHRGNHVAETTHDYGELGGLAQSRIRFLMVARHQEKVPQPVKRPLRTLGEVLGDMQMPGDELGRAMHRVPRLQWKT